MDVSEVVVEVKSRPDAVGREQGSACRARATRSDVTCSLLLETPRQACGCSSQHPCPCQRFIKVAWKFQYCLGEVYLESGALVETKMSATLPFRDINVHASSTYYAFSSPSSPNSPTLVVDRPSGDLRLNDGKLTGGHRVSSISGILGIVKLRLGM